MRHAVHHALLILCIAASLATACIGVTEFEAVPEPTPMPPDRMDCGEIFGSAFRSQDERDWFVANCSAWEQATLGAIEPAPPAAPGAPTGAPAQPPPAQAQPPAPPAGEHPRCAQMRGQPYANAADRAWFLANCTGSATQPSFDPGPDRFSCDEIRGTRYRSGNERSWYLQNCGVAP
jgi:hypothetical protein